ncbi:MAG TPA: adenylate/guanylate cyclase domain-containing protein [Opitutaceae bacterium]|nr:adenylate/guanylate cyclase domain-containing protein [Opitutaceae bacterium]
MAHKKAKITPYLRWLVLLPIPALWCLGAHFGWLNFLENKALDWRFQFRGPIASPVKVVYVDIDSQALSEIGGFPWSRSYFARVLPALVEKAGAKAVGVDIVFSETGVAEAIDWKKRVEGNRELARYLARNPPVVVAASYAASVDRDINGRLVYRTLPLVSRLKDIEKAEPPEAPAFRISENDPRRLWSPALVGLIDSLHGETRMVPAYAPSYVRTYLHLSVELARLHFGVAPDGVVITDDHIDLVRPDGVRAARIPLINRQMVEINWFSPWMSAEHNPRISFSTVYQYADMLESEDAAERNAAERFFAQPDFRGAIVLIGPVDPLLQDLAVTSFDETPVPKVGVHGNMVKTIAAGLYLNRLSPTANHGIVFGLTLLVAAFAAAGGSKGARTKLTAALLLTAYTWFSFKLFADHHLVLPMIAPLGAALSTSFAAIVWQLIVEEKQKGRIKGMFGAYVSPQLVERMVESGEDPQLGGHDGEITAYFSDIQSFSTFSEKLGSGPLVELMNEYLTACTDIVQAQGGTLDKYIGDAVVAMFGAPLPLKDHAYRACVATQLVHRKLAELRQKWRDEGGKWPEIVWNMQTRVGLNTGVCMIGNMGSRTRFNYTMMGDNVNLAARMESGAKSWGAYTMCAEATRLACVEHGGDHVVFRPLGRIVVKGRTQAVPIHEITGLKEHTSDEARECFALFGQGLEKHYARDWDGAISLFKKSAMLEPNQPGVTPGVSSNPSLVYINITEHYKHEPPPADWDGVYVMKEK